MTPRTMVAEPVIQVETSAPFVIRLRVSANSFFTSEPTDWLNPTEPAATALRFRDVETLSKPESFHLPFDLLPAQTRHAEGHLITRNKVVEQFLVTEWFYIRVLHATALCRANKRVSTDYAHQFVREANCN